MSGFILLLLIIHLTINLSYSNDITKIHHDLNVRLYPEENRLAVIDTITIPEGFQREFYFNLHSGLIVSSRTPGVLIGKFSNPHNEIIFTTYKVKLSSNIKSFTLEYNGIINHEIEPYGKEQARGFKMTPGIISEEGVYLAGSSFWYPNFEKEFITFNLHIWLPKDWDAISQGDRVFYKKDNDGTLMQWDSNEIQDEIFLIAGKFIEYTKKEDNKLAMVYLRSPDKELAEKYLNATIKYIDMYEQLIGPYPYKKFALVENFWETGLGMPSFTLLGQKIIRFPFIINSSYPHEILHNWWGNSVYPDYTKGNWAEGITAYLSDHLIKELEGNAVEYRQTTLQKYTDYILMGRDFSLKDFRIRHSSSTEAIGYGKSLMFFHMLRMKLGNKMFIDGLKKFYRDNLFKIASFDDLKISFEKVSQQNLDKEFDQWISRTGAPEIRIKNVTVTQEKDVYILNGNIEQIQTGEAYVLDIPVAVSMEGKEYAYQSLLRMNKKIIEFTLRLPSRPLRIDIDPEYDVFRRLNRNEVPPAISQALGAKKMLVLIPFSADETLKEKYLMLANNLKESGPDVVDIKFDHEVKEIPTEYAVAVLGWENRFLNDVVNTLSLYKVNFDSSGIKIDNKFITKKGNSFIFASRNIKNPDIPLILVASDNYRALDGISRKLPHYHKYSYLVFEGDEPVNILKGRWPVFNSPMTLFIPNKDGKTFMVDRGKLSQREPLISIPYIFSKEKMMETIKFLSSRQLMGRGLGSKELDIAANFISDKFREAGLQPGGDQENNYLQTWEDKEYKMSMKNVIGIIPGEDKTYKEESVVIGAHYDHLGIGWPDVREDNKGKIHPGADDNASGVAVLIELASVLKKQLHPDRSIVFVAFTGEEAGKKGSKYYIENQRRLPISKCIAMINIDTVGRLGKRKLLALGAYSAKEWPHILKGAGSVTGVEIDIIYEELDASDQVSFHNVGVPAIQFFTGPHSDYHRPTDTADKIDSDGLLKVASVVKEIIEYLSKSDRYIIANLKPSDKSVNYSKNVRKVHFGVVPDFSFKGEGVRVSDIIPDSPAASSGLSNGDIIVNINEHNIKCLKDFSEVLKLFKPGDNVSIIFLRDGKKINIQTELIAR